MGRVTHRWRYEDASGAPVPGPEIAFEDRAEAEEWLGGAWGELLAAGVDQVTLLDDDGPGGPAEVYGPMSLHPA